LFTFALAGTGFQVIKGLPVAIQIQLGSQFAANKVVLSSVVLQPSPA